MSYPFLLMGLTFVSAFKLHLAPLRVPIFCCLSTPIHAPMLDSSKSASLDLSSPLTHPGRNVVIFVADGLRPSSVTSIDAPTLYGIRQEGVNFTNSHSLFPTFTTPNASAIATGPLPGRYRRLQQHHLYGLPCSHRQ